MKKYFLLVSLLLTSCAPSGYQQFYHPYVDVNQLQEIERLSSNQEPKVYGTDNFDRDIYILRSKNYYVIGYSAFNGAYEDINNAKEQAKKIGATIVLTSSEYTNTLTSQVPLFIPQQSTTTYSGTVSSNNKTGSFSGKSTKTETNAVYMTSNQMRYDQTAIYFVKSTKKLRFGIYIDDLTPEDRLALKRNTGAKIGVVVEDTPCFYANVMPGDVLLKIDNTIIKNAEQAALVMQEYSSKPKSKFIILREDKEIELNIDLE